MNNFANNLRTVRKNRGLTYQQLSDATGIKKHRLSDYEDGRCEPKIDGLISLSCTLKISIDELIKSDFSDNSQLQKIPTSYAKTEH